MLMPCKRKRLLFLTGLVLEKQKVFMRLENKEEDIET